MADQNQSMDLNSRIQRLEDLEAIQRLKAKYFWALDNKDWEQWATVFTEDVIVDFSDDFSRDAGRRIDGTISGRDNLVAFISASLPAHVITVHQGHMPEIDFTGPDTATGRWQMWDWLDFGDRRLHGFGYYHEEYRRVNGAWLMSKGGERRLFTEWTPAGASAPAYMTALIKQQFNL